MWYTIVRHDSVIQVRASNKVVNFFYIQILN